MSTSAALLQFAAEFVGMVAAAAGLGLLCFRALPTGRRSRPGNLALGAGLLALAVVAAVRGATLGLPPVPLELWARVAAAALVVVGASLSVPGRADWAALSGAGALVGASAVTRWAGGAGTVTDVILLAGDVLLAAAVLTAGRRSVAARVAATSAASLLLVVLVLSAALSSVLTGALGRDRLSGLGSLAAADARQIAGRAGAAVASASSLSAALDLRLAGTTAGASTSAAARQLRALAGGYPSQQLGYLPAAGGAAGPAAPVALAAQAVSVLASARCGTGAAGALVPLGGRLVAVAAEALCPAPGSACPTCRAGRLGTVVVVSTVGDADLEALRAGRPTTAVAVVAGHHTLASAGPAPPPAAVTRAVRLGRPLTAGGYMTAVDRIVSVGGADPVLLVVSTSAAGLVADRDTLLRTLFAIALGGALLSLGTAAVTGDRITVGLRRLTTAATRVRAGMSPQPVGFDSPDEVGALAGAFDAMVGAVEDKSAELRAAAESEARLHARLQAVVEGMGEALVATDRHGRVTDFNRAAELLTGLSAAGVVGRPLSEVMAVPAAGEGATVGELEVPGLPPLPVVCTSGALGGPLGEDAGTVLVLRDLRHDRELERMKSELLSRVGHELRTPLTGVLGYVDLLLGRELRPEQERNFHLRIRSAAERQLRVIQLLEFVAASGGGRIVVQREPLDLRALLREALPAWQERLGPDRALALRTGRRMPPLAGDARWLRVALDELVDNAAKFSPDGGRVAVRAEAADGDAGVRVAVVDHGVGMTAEQQSAALADFAQADASDTRPFGGLGLGLTLALRVVEGHGGQLEVRSAPGRGTSVVLFLPVGNGQAIAASAPAARLH